MGEGVRTLVGVCVKTPGEEWECPAAKSGDTSSRNDVEVACLEFVGWSSI